MPSLVIETNVESSVIPEKFFEEMTSLIAEMLGKPESVSDITSIDKHSLDLSSESVSRGRSHIVV